MRSLALLFAVLGLSLAAPAASAEEAKPRPKIAAAKKIAKAKETGPTARFPGFESLDGGGSRIFVELSKPVSVSEQASDLILTYSLGDVRIETGNDKNALETYFLETPVLRARLRRHKKDTVLEIVLRAQATAKHRVVETSGGARLEVDFPPGKYSIDKDRDTAPEGPRRGKDARRAKPAPAKRP